MRRNIPSNLNTTIGRYARQRDTFHHCPRNWYPVLAPPETSILLEGDSTNTEYMEYKYSRVRALTPEQTTQTLPTQSSSGQKPEKVASESPRTECDSPQQQQQQHNRPTPRLKNFQFPRP